VSPHVETQLQRPQFIVCQAPGVDLDTTAAIVAAIAEATEAADLLARRAAAVLLQKRRRVMASHDDGRPLVRPLLFPIPLTWDRSWPATSTPAQDLAVRMAVGTLQLARLNLPVADAIARVLEAALEEVLNPAVDEHERQRTEQALRDLVASWSTESRP
jgi:hypothetical protein